jgi:ABC-type branched-subunit amino acid transport system substrate-binding protein
MFTDAGRSKTLASLVAAALVLVSCDGGGGTGSTTPRATAPRVSAAPTSTTPATTPSSSGGTAATGGTTSGWTVNTSSCPDPARVGKAITGTITIGTAAPLTGGPAAAFGPVKDGFVAYIKYASDNGLLPGYTLSTDVRDDQYDPGQTPAVVDGLIADGADLFAGIIGTPNHLAVRDTLNHACIPQLAALTGAPVWGQIADYPWTTGGTVPYDVEASIYAAKLAELKAGATVALFYVSSDFGKAYADAFKKQAADLGLQVVDEQTIEADATDPPTSQVAAMAGKLPDAIIASPLGLQCPAFLNELANAKTQAAGWAPMVFLTNTCASKLFLGLAGTAAEGVYTSSNLLDANDPKNAAAPGVKTFLETVAAAKLPGDPGVVEVGWNAGEATVAILNAALKSGTLSRKSIIEAARTLTFTPSLARPSVQYKMSGDADPFAFQTLQVLQWSTASQTFAEIGDPITQFES